MSNPDEQPSEQEAQPKRVLNQRTYHSLIDERIAQAQAEGLFRDLPGQGKPLPPDDDSLVPEADRAGYHLLKSNGFAPLWIEARKDLDAERMRLERWLVEANRGWARMNNQRRAALRAEYRRKLDELQRAILVYNLRLPPGVAHLSGLQVEAELRRLGGASDMV